MNKKEISLLQEALEESRKGQVACNDADNYNDSLIHEGWVEALEFALSLGDHIENRNKTSKRKKKKQLLKI